MKVLTFHRDEFEKVCHELEKMVFNSGFEPDLVIVVANAGRYLKQYMQFNGADSFDIKLQRAATKKLKKYRFMKVLPHLPLFLKDLLRVLESSFRQFSRNNSSRKDLNTKADLKVPIDRKKILGKKKILIVDDAIDTGETIKQIVQALSQVVDSDAQVKTAVITKTMKEPALKPDYYIYDMVLCRFFWAADYKAKK